MSERKLLFLMTAEQARAFARLVESATHGDGAAACRLGDMYREGQGGLRYSPEQAYRLSAAQKLGTASMNLGYCYLRGHGVAADKAEALRLFREAAE